MGKYLNPDNYYINDITKTLNGKNRADTKKFRLETKLRLFQGSAILWYSMQLKDRYPTPVETMDLLTQKLDSKSIILLGKCSS